MALRCSKILYVPLYRDVDTEFSELNPVLSSYAHFLTSDWEHWELSDLAKELNTGMNLKNVESPSLLAISLLLVLCT